jgi:hypothetical protein
MNLEFNKDLINYALNIGILEKNENDIYILNDKEYHYDFSLEDESLIKDLRMNLPITEVIDLVKEAISLNIVTDISGENKLKDFLSLENYIDIVNENYFLFKINSESFDDTIYKVTFDKRKHDIKRKIEYASRTSQFVDTLMKRIMAKYNILLVRKADFKTDKYPILKESNYYDSKFSHIIDTESETDTIQNEIKVMVNYKDNFNNQTLSENVIDDIFISLSKNEISYGFYNIGQSEAEPVYDAINENVDLEDIDSLLRIRNLISDPEVKFNIFETLRANKDTNLAKLISSREENLYETKSLEPKIEFTVTPLSIYCNHIVEKKCVYEITSKNPYYKDYPLLYEITYNPANLSDISFDVDIDGILERVKNDDIILAFDDAPVNGPITPRMTIERCAVMLYGFNERFNNDIYKDVYFLKDSLVKLINNKVEPFDGNLDDNTYLKSQIVKGEITGNYYYIGDAVKLNANDILGAAVIDDSKDHYVFKEYARECPICHHKFGATNEVWKMYTDSHLIVNMDSNTSCCDYCAKEEDNQKYNDGLSILYSKGQKKYFLDNINNIRCTDRCISCENKEDSILFVDLNMKTHLPDMCISCRRYYCPTHIDSKTHVCINCSKNVASKDIKELDPKLQVLARMNIQAKDMFKKKLSFYFNEEWNSLWIYSEAKNKLTTYYLITDDNKKFMHLEKVFKIKR